MRSETLVFLHILAGMALVGGLLAVAIVGLAARRAREPELPTRLISWGSVFVLVSVVATLVLGEATRARGSPEGTWLDVASGLAYAGLLLPAIGLTVLAAAARTRPRLAARAGTIALAVTGIALAVVFLMAAKPA